MRDGLVEAPVAQPFGDRTCPIVASDVRLDVGSGRADRADRDRVYYEHKTVSYFDFGAMPVAKQVDVDRIAARYVLRRDGEEPLSEPIRGVDIDGDGDIVDTNDIFDSAPADPMRSPLARTIIGRRGRAATASIDTSGDDTIGRC